MRLTPFVYLLLQGTAAYISGKKYRPLEHFLSHNFDFYLMILPFNLIIMTFLHWQDIHSRKMVKNTVQFHSSYWNHRNLFLWMVLRSSVNKNITFFWGKGRQVSNRLMVKTTTNKRNKVITQEYSEAKLTNWQRMDMRGPECIVQWLMG